MKVLCFFFFFKCVQTLLICFIDDPIDNGKAFLALVSLLNKPIISMGECRFTNKDCAFILKIPMLDSVICERSD
jgi:hypothetical protein